MVIIADPDVMLDGVARHHRKADGTSQFHTYRTFFEQVRNTSPFCCASLYFYYNRSFFQDRLGTNIGKVEEKGGAFFEQAAAGTLPNFVWIAPNATTMDHPCEDVAKVTPPPIKLQLT
eukprot:COSAG06_NODE_1692_length_8705_cov_3.636765_8_plen_118_part_00